MDIFLDDLRARNSKLLLLRSIDSSLVNASIASKLSDDLDTRSVDFEIGNLRVTGFTSSYSISFSNPSVDLENQPFGAAVSKLSGDFDDLFDADLLLGSFASNSSNTSVFFGARLDDFLPIIVCSSSLLASTASRLSGDREATLGGFLGSLASNSSKMSDVRDKRFDDFLPIDGFFGSVGVDALLLFPVVVCRLSNESSAIVVMVDVGVLATCDPLLLGGLRFLGRTDIRWWAAVWLKLALSNSAVE